MPPVQDLLEYYLALVKVHDVFLLTFNQRQLIVLLILHDYFSEHISMIDICSLAQYFIFDPSPESPDESDLEYIIWCCSELIPAEEQHRVYDQPQQPQAELIKQLKDYLYKYHARIDMIILDRSPQKLIA